MQLEVLGNPPNLPSSPTLKEGANIPPNWIVDDNPADFKVIVPSRSIPGKMYIITVIKETRAMSCQCKGFFYKGDCSHIALLNSIAIKKPRRRGVQDTSIESYHQVSLEGRRAAVMAALTTFGPMSGRELARNLGWPINRVTGRVKELREMGKVEDAGKVFDKETNRNVYVWRAAGWHKDE